MFGCKQNKSMAGWLSSTIQCYYFLNEWKSMRYVEFDILLSNSFARIGPIMKYSNRDILKSETCNSLIKHLFVCFVFSHYFDEVLWAVRFVSLSHTTTKQLYSILFDTCFLLFPSIITNQRNCIVFFNVQFSIHA